MLRKLLKDNNLTQRELALGLEVSERTIRRNIDKPSKCILLASERFIGKGEKHDN